MLLSLQLLNLLEEAGEAPDFEAVTNVSGTAVAADGVMGAIFLDDSTPVPASAVFLNGFAHDNDGMRYVALWPASDAVTYRRGIAARNDGAMIIATSGTTAAHLAGWAVTSRGEVLSAADTPDVVLAGFGLLDDGTLCLSEVA